MLLVAATTLASPPELDDSTMTLLRLRLETAHAEVVREANGKLSCSVNAPTGERRLDEKLCETATRCAARGETSAAAINACVDKRKPQMLSEMRRLREAAR